MAKTFSFEEASAPVATEQPTPKTFSFEEATAKPQPVAQATPKTFSFEEASAPQTPIQRTAPATKTNIFGESYVEGVMDVPPTTPVSKFAGVTPSQQGFAPPNLQDIGIEPDPDKRLLNALVGDIGTTDTRVIDKKYELAQQSIDYAKQKATDAAQKAKNSGAPDEDVQAIYEKVFSGLIPSMAVSDVKESAKQWTKPEDIKFTPGATGLADTWQAAKATGVAIGRGAAKGEAGLSQAGGGQLRFMQDMLGIDASNTVSTLNSIDKHVAEIGDSSSHPVQLFEGAISSISQQLPALVGGALTGSEALVLGNMYLNSFGQTYDDSRRKGLDMGDSTVRSGAFAALEVLGEKFGLGDTLKGIKAASKGVPAGELTTYFAKALAKEVPGEQLTYAGQFAVDKGYGLNPEAGLKAFMDGAIDTLGATVIQGGLMLGGGHLANKAISSLENKNSELYASKLAEATRESALQQWKMMREGKPLQPRAKVQQEIVNKASELTAAEEQTPTAETPTPTEVVPTQVAPEAQQQAELIKKYVAEGQTRENALLLANQDIADIQAEEVKNAGRIDTGPTGVSTAVSGPTIAGEPAGGIEQLVGTTMAGVGSTTGATATGTTVQPSTLSPTIAPLYTAMQESGKDFKNPVQVRKFLEKTVFGGDTALFEDTLKLAPNLVKDLFTEWKTPEVTPVQIAPEVTTPTEVVGEIPTTPIETPVEVPVDFPVETPVEAPVETPVLAPDEQVRTASKSLNEIFDPSAYEDIGELKVKHKEFGANRIQTIANLQDIVSNPEYQNSYVASAAQEMLNHPSITPKELKAATNLETPARTANQEIISKQAIGEDTRAAIEAQSINIPAAPNQSIRVKPSANVARLAALLGPQLYGDMTKMADITTKELFQNSFDAIKALVEREGKTDGKIDIITDNTARTITIVDNGNGMTPDIIQKAFLTLAGTNKETERSSGGFGIAKMQFLFGSKSLQLITIRNGVESTLNTSGAELMASLEDESVSPTITTRQTDAPNGTTVIVQIPESFKNPSTGEEQEIDFVSRWSAPSSIVNSPLFEPITVTFNGDTVDIGNNFPINNYTHFADIKFEWGNARIVVSKEEVNAHKNIKILSNGLFQFESALKENPLEMYGDNVPRRFFINVEPTVKPDEPGYPFELSRQGFSLNTKEDFAQIFNYLTLLYKGNKAAEVSQGFGDIEYLFPNGRSSGVKKLAPELSVASDSMLNVNEGDNIEVVAGKLIVNGREVPTLTKENIANMRQDLSKFKIEQSDINPNDVMLHSNLGVADESVESALWKQIEKLESERTKAIAEADSAGSYEQQKELYAKYEALTVTIDDLHNQITILRNAPTSEENKIVPIVNLAKKEFGAERFNTFVQQLGNVFIKVRNEIVAIDPTKYDSISKNGVRLSELGIGVSFDKEYHGVHVRVPFHGMFVNPAALTYDDIQRQSDSLYYTMVHEAAHYKQGGHDANFWAEDNQLAIELRAAGVEPLLTHELRVLLTTNKDIVDFLRSKSNDPSAKNIGKQFEDAGYQGTNVGLGEDNIDNIKDEASTSGGPPNQAGPSGAGGAGGNIPPNQTGNQPAGQGQNNTGLPLPATQSRTIKAKKAKVDKILEKLDRSESPETMGGLLGELVESNTWADKKEIFKALYDTGSNKSIRAVLGALTTSQIVDWVGDKIPHLNQVTNLVTRMAVMRSKMLASIADNVSPWVDYAKKYTVGARTLGRLMHYTTLAEVDPTLYPSLSSALVNDAKLVDLRTKVVAATTPKSKAAYTGQITSRVRKLTQAYTMWHELSTIGTGEGQTIYSKIKDYYNTTFKLYRAILDERVLKAAIPGNINDASTPKGRLMAAIRLTYEDTKKIGVYFPLMRRGNFWMSVGSGVNKEFYMFESELSRDLFLRKRVRQLKKAGEYRTLDQMLEAGDLDRGNDLTKLRNLTVESSTMLQNIFKLIDTQGISDAEALKDSVYQLYLLTMPEQSFRKQFIHRKGTTGFSGDALRNFVSSGYSTAGQLSRLKYGPDITTEMDAAHDALKGNPEKAKLEQFLNEVGVRVGQELVPTIEDTTANRVANMTNQVVFFWKLTSPRAAIANMTAIPIFGLPVLASKYGELKASAALAKYYNVYNHTTFIGPDGKYTPLSVGLSKHVQGSPILAAAFEEASERGVTEITRTYDLLTMARTPSLTHQNMASRGARQGVILTGILFHHSERLNREIMFMTSFELAYNKALEDGLASGINGAAFNRAIDEAVKNTYDSMFNYTKFNRPRIMRSPSARVVFQFKLFPQQVTAYYVRNFTAMLPFVKGNTAKRAAATQFFGSLMMTGLFAGITGMPLYSVIVGVIQGILAALRDKDEPVPIEERNLDLWFRNIYLPDMFGDNFANIIEKGPISTLSNIDIASSTSLNNLWFRDTKYDSSTTTELTDFLVNIAGPGASMGMDIARAIDDFKSGHFNEGVEKLLPAFIKGAYTQHIWGKEGIKTKTQQAPIYDSNEVTKAMRFWKFVGFNPTELTRIQETNYPTAELIRKATDEKQQLLSRFDLELNRGEDTDALEKVLIDMTNFTAANPEMAIMPDVIVGSVLKRAKIRAMADRGLVVPPKLMPRVYAFIAASRPTMDAKEEQAKFDALRKLADETPAEEETAQ